MLLSFYKQVLCLICLLFGLIPQAVVAQKVEDLAPWLMQLREVEGKAATELIWFDIEQKLKLPNMKHSPFVRLVFLCKLSVYIEQFSLYNRFFWANDVAKCVMMSALQDSIPLAQIETLLTNTLTKAQTPEARQWLQATISGAYAALKQPKKSEEWLQKMLQQLKMPKQKEFWLLSQYIVNDKTPDRLVMIGKIHQFLFWYDSLQLKNKDLQADLYFDAGNIHYHFKNYTQAIHYYTQVHKLYEQYVAPNRLFIGFYNNFGMTYLQTNAHAQALPYFQKALQYAEQFKDTIWQGIIKGNIAQIHLTQGQYPQAIILLKDDIKYSLQGAEYSSAMGACLTLSYIYAKIGDFDKATYYLQKADSLANKYPYDFKESVKLRYYKTKSTYYELQGDLTKAYQYQQQYIELNEKQAKENYQEKALIIDMHANLEKKRRELKNLEKNLAHKQWGNVFFTFIALLLGIVGYLFWYKVKIEKLKVRTEKPEKRTDQEKRQLEDLIQQKDRQLVLSSLQIQKNNELLVNLQKKIKDISTDEETKKHLKFIDEALKQQDTLTQDWDKVKRYFEQVHPQFFQTLTQKYPLLTSNDLKICAYLKLQMDSKTIARMLNITPESFATYRNRLRKKLQLTPEVDLQKFIMNIA